MHPFDPTFDTESDSSGRDPDKYSGRLHAAHLMLWSKPLPSGDMFLLTDTRPAGYLRHESALGTFDLASDSVVHTYRRDGLRPIFDSMAPGELEKFVRVAFMVGAYIIFPVGNGRTINQVRGFDKKTLIDDRFDLTLECIRLHYLGLENGLSEVLGRNDDFFALFGDFEGYVEFFLLQDLVDDDSNSVRFFLDGGFERPALPQDLGDYREYAQRATDFVLARNSRMIAAVG